MLFQRINRVCLLLCATVLFFGCGPGGPQVVPVKGVVKYKGEAMPKISVVFTPSDGKGMIATGMTDAKGEFSLQTNAPGDGAMIGNYAVSFRYDSGEIPDMFAPKKVTSPIPEKYSDASKSGHTAKVDADKSKNNFPFDLQ